MTRMKIFLAAAAFVLGGSFVPGAAPREAAADTEVDVSFFYSALAPHGEWIQVQSYGWAWAPENVDYGWRPYTVGQWSWVEPYGWTWISFEPWGWATYHYGRWAYVEDYGWVWFPGTTWGPAWVAFRYGDPWIGWAPLPPTTNWGFDVGLDLGSLNLNVNVGTYAWNFVSLRYFAEQDLRSRVYVTSYNPYLVQRTQSSTRYTPIAGGFANLSVDPAVVERARGSPIPRRRLQEAPALSDGTGARVAGDSVILYRPRIAPKAPVQTPAPRVQVGPGASARVDINAWTAQRQAALKAHLDAQRKALETQDQDDAPPPGPGMSGGAGNSDEAAKRREAALKALEEERKRLERLLELQRKRREQEQQQQPPPPPPPPGMGDGDGHGKKDKDKDKDKDSGHGME